MSQSRMAGSVSCVALIATLGATLAGASDHEALPAAEWLIATVDSTREVGYNVSVAVDPETGHTYISYYEGIDGDLWLARTGAPVGNCGSGNTWECRVLDSDSIVGEYSAIAAAGWIGMSFGTVKGERMIPIGFNSTGIPTPGSGKRFTLTQLIISLRAS